MALTKTDTAESVFNAFGWHNREALRRFVLTLLSALLVGCGGDGDSAADTAAPQAAPLQEQILVFTQAGPLNLVVGDTLSNVASGGLGTGVIRYSSSDTTVAAVDATGRLTVVGAGIATITAKKAADTQYAAASADYDVSATPVPQDPGPEPQRIGFDQPGPFNLVVGDTLRNVASGGLGTGVIRYSSSDTTVATVDATGQLTVVGAGIAMITAEKAADANYTAASASYLVQTTQASQAIGFDQPGPFHLMVGDTLSNMASGGSGTGVISYSSSDTTVATVDAAGQLTVVGIGTATITAEKAADAQYTAASASYTVTAPSRVSVTAWVGREDAQVQVDLPLSTSGMAFFRSNEANCDLSNVTNCANGQSNIVHGGETVEDTAFTLDQTAYYVLQHGANQASLEVSSTSTERFRGRSNHQVVTYNNRLWLIGGGSANNNNDVWWSKDGVTWIEATGSADFLPRARHQVVAHNNRLWVIGGWNGTDYYDDVWWSEDGVTWTEVPPEARGSEHFSPRRHHQVVAHNDRLWLIGGWDGSARNNDVWWSQDGVTWTEVPPEARGSEHFSPRDGHQVVAHNDRLWLIGGWDGARKNDVWWSQDGATWTEVPPEARGSEHFSPRNAHQVVAHNDRLWLIGGWDGSANNNDVWWSEDGATWTEVPPEARGSEHFSPRSQYQAVAHNDRLWLIGGWDGSANNNDVWWSEDGETWESRTRFSPREAHQVVVHNNRLWVIGGSGGGLRNDVWWSVDGVNWTEVPNNGDRFSPRSAHQAVSFKDKLWVIGGSEGTNDATTDDSKDDVWYSEDDGRTWKEVVVTGDQLSGRSRHQVVVHKSAVSNEDELFLIGGWDGGDDNVQGQVGYKSDVWRSADGETWERVTENVNTTLISDNDLNVGIQVVSYKEQLWIINGMRNHIFASQEEVDGSMTWTHYQPTGVPNITTHHNLLLGPRHNNQAVVHDNKLWVIGGYDGAFKNDVWWSEDGEHWYIAVDVSNNVGTPGFLPPFPPRQRHGFVSYNNRLWVIGGNCHSNKETCIVAPGGKNDVWRSEDGENWRLGFHDVFQFQ